MSVVNLNMCAFSEGLYIWHMIHHEGMFGIIRVSKKRSKVLFGKSSYVHLAVMFICEIMEQFLILKLNFCALHSGLYT